MKIPQLRFGLLTVVFFPSVLVAANWLAISWTRTESWTYNQQASPGVVTEVESEVRLAGWPLSYNAAFPSETFGLRNMHWLPFVADCVLASIAACTAYCLVRLAVIRCRIRSNVESTDSDRVVRLKDTD